MRFLGNLAAVLHLCSKHKDFIFGIDIVNSSSGVTFHRGSQRSAQEVKLVHVGELAHSGLKQKF